MGSVHRVPVADAPGSLFLCGLDVVGPDPAALLGHLGATTLVCLQTDAELERRYPDYLEWLATSDGWRVVRLATDDHLVADDGDVADLVSSLRAELNSGEDVVVHCGAGWGRAGVIAVLVMVAFGADVPTAIADLRAARPAAGPQSVEQEDQINRLVPTVRAGPR